MHRQTSDFISEGHFSLTEQAFFDDLKQEREILSGFDRLFGSRDAPGRGRHA